MKQIHFEICTLLKMLPAKLIITSVHLRHPQCPYFSTWWVGTNQIIGHHLHQCDQSCSFCLQFYLFVVQLVPLVLKDEGFCVIVLLVVSRVGPSIVSSEKYSCNYSRCHLVGSLCVKLFLIKIVK